MYPKNMGNGYLGVWGTQKTLGALEKMLDDETIRNSCCYISPSSRRLSIVGVILLVVVDSLFSSRVWHVPLLVATLVFACCSYEADAMLVHTELSESTTEEAKIL